MIRCCLQFFIAKEGLVASKQDVQENTDSDKIIPGLDVTKENGICRIKFNRPQKLNALTHEVTIFNTFSPVSCHWALSIPPENIRKPEDFLCFQ